MKLYKRNAQGKPIVWEIQNLGNAISVKYGLVGKEGRIETYNTKRKIEDEIKSAINAKRKEGYKELRDLHDNAPDYIPGSTDLYCYLLDYLPKDNTHADGSFIPMLCKTLEDNKPFEKHAYFGQWKINGERCIITASKDDDIFQSIHLNYHSRIGIDWTDKLYYLDDYILPCIPNYILEMMLEEGVGLDGELYIPGYTINDINSFIKNTQLPQHYKLQYWLYDLAIDEMCAITRYNILFNNFCNNRKIFTSKEDHLNNTQKLVLLPSDFVKDFNDAIEKRDYYISLGFEGLVIRDDAASYQFGGKRNQSMMKFKKIKDGKFEIIEIHQDKRGLPIFILKNDINNECFECTLNATQDEQKRYISTPVKEDAIKNKLAFVEYRERSGVKQVPFHSKIIRFESK